MISNRPTVNYESWILIWDAKIYNFGHNTPIHELRYGEYELLAWRVIDVPNFVEKHMCMHVFGAVTLAITPSHPHPHTHVHVHSKF